MKCFLIPLLLVMSLAYARAVETPAPAASRVAKVAIDEIHDDLLELVLARPENAALKKAKETDEANDVKRSAAMQAAQAEGKEGKDLVAALKDFPANDYQSIQKLQRLVRVELLRIIAKKYGSRFTIVIDDENNDSVIYLEGEIIDLTQTLKQAIQLNDF